MQAMLDIGFAVFSFLAGMGFNRKFKGELEHGGIGFRVVFLKVVYDLIYDH
jgi:hypothetical protein